MPKMKTNRGAMKRFKKTGNGSLKHRRSNRNHILTKKSPKRKRHLRGLVSVNDHNIKSVNKLLKLA